MDQRVEGRLIRLATPESFRDQLQVSKAGLWRLLRLDSRAPKPLRVGRRSVRFIQSEIDAFIEALAVESRSVGAGQLVLELADEELQHA